MNKGIDNLLKLGQAFENSSLSEARDLIGLIYPENFTFRGNDFQTTRVNEIVNCIYLVNNELGVKKNGTKDDFYLLSRVVTPSIQIPNHFMQDLKKLAYFNGVY